MRLPLVLSLALTLACDSTAPREHGPPPPVPEFRYDQLYSLTVPTYDGSGQAVHPDAALTPPGWGGATTQLFVTPYPNGDATKENPSLLPDHCSTGSCRTE